MAFYRRLVLAVCVLGILAAAVLPAGARAGEGLTIAAASSLSFSMKEAARAYEEKTGTRVVVSFGSTGTLTSQIRSGAPFDLFFSADTAHVEELAGEGLIIPGSVRVYASGRLAVVVSLRSGIEAGGLRILLDPAVKRVAIANPEHAPYGAAAVQAMKAEGIFDGVREKLVYGENIRQAARFVQTGDAEAGIVAMSVAGVPGVKARELPQGLYAPIRQAAGVVAGSANRDLALGFLEFVTGPEGAAILERYGFGPPGPIGQGE